MQKVVLQSSSFRTIVLFTAALLICVAANVCLDIIESRLQNSAFYFFESFLFSSYWWLFLPFLSAQFFLARANRNVPSILFVVLPLLLHLFCYPAVVWLLSALFYYHTFAFWQTFNYALTEYTFISFTLYSVPYLLYRHFENKSRITTKPVSGKTFSGESVKSLLVADGYKRTTIFTEEILFISANTPYVTIHLKTRHYLYNETLKTMLEKLDPRLFVRIHKSTIVNISVVKSYESRLNGDYDLVVDSGQTLRVSRNYAPLFKEKFALRPQVTTL